MKALRPLYLSVLTIVLLGALGWLAFIFYLGSRID
jgi:hypothetical protein